MGLRWNRSALANGAFAIAAIYLSIWNFTLHYMLGFSFWALEGTIVAAFLRRSPAWRSLVLVYAFFLLLKATTPEISNLTGKDLRILALGGQITSCSKPFVSQLTHEQIPSLGVMGVATGMAIDNGYWRPSLATTSITLELVSRAKWIRTPTRVGRERGSTRRLNLAPPHFTSGLT